MTALAAVRRVWKKSDQDSLEGQAPPLCERDGDGTGNTSQNSLLRGKSSPPIDLPMGNSTLSDTMVCARRRERV